MRLVMSKILLKHEAVRIRSSLMKSVFSKNILYWTIKVLMKNQFVYHVTILVIINREKYLLQRVSKTNSYCVTYKYMHPLTPLFHLTIKNNNPDKFLKMQFCFFHSRIALLLISMRYYHLIITTLYGKNQELKL